MTVRRRLLGGLGAGFGLGLGALGATGLSACALAPPVSRLLQAPPPGLPRRADVSASTPFVSQDDTLCGPAALAMVLAAAGRPTPLDRLTREVYLPGRQGSLQWEMQAALRRHGVLAHPVSPSLEAALVEVAAGTPVLLLLNLALPWWPRWHYAVLLGYDLDRQQAWLHSGTQARQAWTLQTLESTWARSGHWGLLALPPGRLPQQARADDLLSALLAFEQAQGASAAVPAWQAASERFPDHLALSLGQGNALLAAGQLRAAADALQQTAQRSRSAAAWNNLAVARARLGQREAARAALQQAETRARAQEPGFLAEILLTRQELGL